MEWQAACGQRRAWRHRAGTVVSAGAGSSVLYGVAARRGHRLQATAVAPWRAGALGDKQRIRKATLHSLRTSFCACTAALHAYNIISAENNE